MTTDNDGERCECCGKKTNELSQAMNLPGTRGEDGVYRARWVCDQCLPADDE